LSAGDLKPRRAAFSMREHPSQTTPTCRCSLPRVLVRVIDAAQSSYCRFGVEHREQLVAELNASIASAQSFAAPTKPRPRRRPDPNWRD